MRHHGRIKRVFLSTLAAIFVALISTCLYVNYFGPVDQASMSYSVGREEGGFYADCEPQATLGTANTRIWSCDLMTTEESEDGSGTAGCCPASPAPPATTSPNAAARLAPSSLRGSGA